MPKNIHAQALRAIPSEARTAASIANGRKGGRPALYRMHRGHLERRHGDRWLTLEAPYDAAAQAWIRRHR